MSEESAPSGEATATPDVDVENVDQDTTPKESPDSKAKDYEARLEARLEELSDQNRQQADEFRRLQESLAAEPEETEDDPFEEGDDGYEEQEAQKLFREAVREEAMSILEPHLREQTREKQDTAVTDLTNRIPALADAEKAKPFVEQAYQWAQELTGQQDPDLVDTPQFVKMIELVYKAAQADERAAQETPPPRHTSLESGAGVAPADAEEDLEARLMELAKKTNSF